MFKMAILLIFVITNCSFANEKKTLNFAVEYTSHATTFYYAEAKNLFKKNNIGINNVKVYVSGASLATAFIKENFDVAYICLVPAIIAYANGGVAIKIIAGTHRDGYGIIVNSKKIKSLRDLEKENVKISVGPKGTVTSFIQEILIEKTSLNPKKVRKNFVTMNASKQLMALKAGIVDAAILPEHFLTLAVSIVDMKILLRSQDLWKEMPGSVIAVSSNLVNQSPSIIETIKEINQQAIDQINKDNTEASAIVASNLNLYQERIRHETRSLEADLSVTTQIAKDSMQNLYFSSHLSPEELQEVINKMFQYGFISKTFDAKELLVQDKI